MRTEFLLRSVLFLAPIALAVGIALVQRPSRRTLTGVLVAAAWNVWSLLAVNLLAVHFGWWDFDPALPSFMGVAIEPWLGWAILWGAVFPLMAPERPLVLVLVAALWFDLIAMPLLNPVLVLGRGWLIGEAAAIAFALLPSLLFARWTVNETHLQGRAAMQVATAVAFLIWLVPAGAIAKADGWDAVAAIPTWRLSLAAQILIIPIAMGARAVGEFVHTGRGTPIPYDPPKQLVTSGPYSYVRNPMQLSIVLIFGVGAAALSNPWLLASAAFAWAYGAGLATWHEDIDLENRFGNRWLRYREKTRDWIPRWRPCIEGESQLLVAFSCSTCSSVGRWFVARAPIGLRILPAESSEDRGIRRISYVHASGSPSSGVAAVFQALGHINLGWAVVGWVLNLPVLRHLSQLIADVFGPTPHRVAGNDYEGYACDWHRLGG